MKKIFSILFLSLGCTSVFGAAVNQVSYGSLTGTEIVDFDDISVGSLLGTNFDSVFVSRGVEFGERFVGQTLTTVGNSDQLNGTPSGSLNLEAGVTGHNLNVSFYHTSNVLSGLGTRDFPDLDAIGEGAISLIFSSDQSEFGFQLIGGNSGNAYIDFFRADGSLIDSIIVSNLDNSFYGFSREGGVEDIRGISIWNDDFGGVGLDNLKHDVVSSVPEPVTYVMLLSGLGLLGFMTRRRKEAIA